LDRCPRTLFLVYLRFLFKLFFFGFFLRQDATPSWLAILDCPSLGNLSSFLRHAVDPESLYNLPGSLKPYLHGLTPPRTDKPRFEHFRKLKGIDGNLYSPFLKMIPPPPAREVSPASGQSIGRLLFKRVPPEFS